jgi:hypothetical protein
LTSKAGSRPLTRVEYATKHNAHAEDIEKVKLFAKRFALTVNEVAPVELPRIRPPHAARTSRFWISG